ncbi:MAG: ATP-grasp domain-containing protein [Myxococcales bacterium]|nr:ATP-grasp domain-containing protein [Myxococcales bacterium]
MRVALLHNAVAEDAAPDERDVLVQVDAIARDLRALCHEPVVIPCDLNLEDLKQRLRLARPAVVFNLVETLGGSGRLITLVPALLDTLGIPYTGAPTTAIFLTSHKVLAKERLRAAGVPTPAWAPGEPPAAEPGRYIVKPVWEDASIGVDDEAVIDVTEGAALEKAIARRSEQLGTQCFAERFVDGRELNLSILGGRPKPEVLPPAEISFIDFPADKPKIVGYQAKWSETSFEYQHTRRRQTFGPEDAGLLAELEALAEKCWRVFGLRGYARVDFRVDASGRPWVLEVNANPCLSPDAGFAAAATAAGLTTEQRIERIVRDALAARR